MIAEEINVIFRCFRGENTPKLYLLHFTKNVSSCYFTAVAIIKDHSDCIYMLFLVVLEKGAYFRSVDNITHIILLTHVETVLYRSLETGTKKNYRLSSNHLRELQVSAPKFESHSGRALPLSIGFPQSPESHP